MDSEAFGDFSKCKQEKQVKFEKLKENEALDQLKKISNQVCEMREENKVLKKMLQNFRNEQNESEQRIIEAIEKKMSNQPTGIDQPVENDEEDLEARFNSINEKLSSALETIQQLKEKEKKQEQILPQPISSQPLQQGGCDADINDKLQNLTRNVRKLFMYLYTRDTAQQPVSLQGKISQDGKLMIQVLETSNVSDSSDFKSFINKKQNNRM